MKWPNSAEADAADLRPVMMREIPRGATIAGLAPIGRRWTGVKTLRGIRPDKGCPMREFSPCYAYFDWVWHKIC